MRLKPDCIRAILLTVEKYVSYNSIISFDEEMISSEPLLDEYPFVEVLYHVKKCHEAGFLQSVKCYSDSITVEDMSYEAHQFLAKIRDERNWGIIKKAVGFARDYSLDTIKAATEGLSSGALKAFLSTIPKC